MDPILEKFVVHLWQLYVHPEYVEQFLFITKMLFFVKKFVGIFESAYICNEFLDFYISNLKKSRLSEHHYLNNNH